MIINAKQEPDKMSETDFSSAISWVIGTRACHNRCLCSYQLIIPTAVFGSGNWHCEVVQRAEGLRFIEPESGGKDVFVHISAVERAGLSSLSEGDKVSLRGRPKPRQGKRREPTRRLIIDPVS